MVRTLALELGDLRRRGVERQMEVLDAQIVHVILLQVVQRLVELELVVGVAGHRDMVAGLGATARPCAAGGRGAAGHRRHGGSQGTSLEKFASVHRWIPFLFLVRLEILVGLLGHVGVALGGKMHAVARIQERSLVGQRLHGRVHV